MQTLTLENDFLKTFAPYVVVAEPESELKKRITSVGSRLRELNAKRGEMFPFEDKTAIDATIKPVSQEYRKLQIVKAGYTEMLSLDAFKLRRSDGLPTFMIINIEDRERVFGIRVTGGGASFTPYSVPKVVQNQMLDVINLMRKKTSGFFAPEEVSIHAELQGHIPDDVRPSIKAAKEARFQGGSKIFDKIFVIAEAPEWKWNKLPVAKTDPLVVGYEDHCEQFFLITTYDPTDLEKYLREQYAHTFAPED